MERTHSLKGIEIYKTSDGLERVGIVYSGGKRRYREMVGDVTAPDPALRSDVTLIRLRKRLKGRYADCAVCIKALRILDERRAAVRAAKDAGLPYLTPKEQADAARVAEQEAAAAAAIAAKTAEDARLPLVFETVAARFLEDAANDYARPEEKRANVRMLARYFAGRMVDGIGRRDVLSYYEARLAASGPFAGLRRVERLTIQDGALRRAAWRVVAEDGTPLSRPLTDRAEAEARAGVRPGPRAPRVELDTLSALFNYLVDPRETGFPALVREQAPRLENPCLGWRPRRRAKTKSGRLEYKPAHSPVVPTERELGAILDASPAPIYRAAWALAYYTMARPESEFCRLTMGDLVYSDDPRARFGRGAAGQALGWVTFRDTKTGEAARSVPLAPEAEAALKAAGLPERPSPEAGETDASYVARVRAWEARPVFAKRSGAPWTRRSYRRPWARTLAEAMAALRGADAQARDLSGMWVRDFRKAAITDARTAGTDGAVAAKIAGHSGDMSDHYTQATDAAARAAILSLKRPDSGAAGTANGTSGAAS